MKITTEDHKFTLETVKSKAFGAFLALPFIMISSRSILSVAQLKAQANSSLMEMRWAPIYKLLSISIHKVTNDHNDNHTEDVLAWAIGHCNIDLTKGMLMAKLSSLCICSCAEN